MAVRVLVVDDSSFFRKSLATIINADPDLQVVGQASNGAEAIEKIMQLKPDVVTMDVTMPVMDGISATRKIMNTCPTPILMLSALTQEGARSTLDALDAGAIDFLPKKIKDISSDSGQAKQEIQQKLKTIASCKVSQLETITQKARDQTLEPVAAKKTDVKVIVIGTSTGGPVALQRVLETLPSSFSVPIVLIQHMPGCFTGPFAERLNQVCKISVKEAADMDELIPGRALLAPGGWQLNFRTFENKPVVHISEGRGDERYRPSVDLTFTSAADTFKDKALAIVLTGMGSDGKEGARALKEKGSMVWAQDESSCVVYGMPMSVINATLADDIVALDNIGMRLAREIG